MLSEITYSILMTWMLWKKCSSFGDFAFSHKTVLLENVCVPLRKFAFARKIFAFPWGALHSLTKYLRFHTQCLHYPEKLCVLSKSFYVSLKSIFSCKTFVLLTKLSLSLKKKCCFLSLNVCILLQNIQKGLHKNVAFSENVYVPLRNFAFSQKNFYIVFSCETCFSQNVCVSLRNVGFSH